MVTVHFYEHVPRGCSVFPVKRGSEYPVATAGREKQVLLSVQSYSTVQVYHDYYELKVLVLIPSEMTPPIELFLCSHLPYKQSTKHTGFRDYTNHSRAFTGLTCAIIVCRVDNHLSSLATNGDECCSHLGTNDSCATAS